MMRVRSFAVSLALVLAFSMVTFLAADQAAVMQKIDAAAAAEGEAAAEAFGAASDLVAKDLEGAGEYATDLAPWVTGVLEVASNTAKAGTLEAEDLAAVKWRVKDFYGVVMPVSAGKMSAAADALASRAEGATGVYKEKIDQAVSSLKGDDKEKAMRDLKVAVPAVYLSKADELVSQEKYKEAAPWVGSAGAFFRLHKLGPDTEVRELASVIMQHRNDLARGIDVSSEQLQ